MNVETSSNRNTISFRNSFQISRYIKSSISLGGSVDKKGNNIYSVSSEFKWKASGHISSYLGFGYSTDGLYVYNFLLKKFTNNYR